jgi:hypothetical protein
MVGKGRTRREKTGEGGGEGDDEESGIEGKEGRGIEVNVILKYTAAAEREKRN